MKTFIKLFSDKDGEIYRFLSSFYLLTNSKYNSLLEYEEYFDNPVDIANMIGVLIDNIDDFKINIWVCLDKDVLINVTKNNADSLIRYLYERFPY